MFSVKHFGRLVRTSRALGLSVPDMVRFLWSYYGPRLPLGSARATHLVEIVVRNQRKPIRLSIRTNGFDHDVVEEIFVGQCYKSDLAEAGTILDLGANIGIAAAFFGTSYPNASLVCVEPVPDNLRLIQRNIEANRLRADLLPAAIGPKDGNAVMELSSDPRQSSALGGDYRPRITGSTLSVEVMSIPSVLSKVGWSRIDLLKVDIEGGEKPLFSGRPEWLEHVGAIVGEGHTGYGYTADQARNDLTPFGFHVEIYRERKGSFLFFASRDRSEECQHSQGA